jgi:hypothetical protein
MNVRSSEAVAQTQQNGALFVASGHKNAPEAQAE